jgi:hypothetical protein
MVALRTAIATEIVRLIDAIKALLLTKHRQHRIAVQPCIILVIVSSLASLLCRFFPVRESNRATVFNCCVYTGALTKSQCNANRRDKLIEYRVVQ